MTRWPSQGGTKSYAFQSCVSPPVYPSERKLKKPMMEKHRRTRMNNAMNELKERIVHAHPHESTKLEKADILEKTVLYVNELESQVEMSRREKSLNFQQGYLQACHELVELIAQQSSSFQNSNANELKQKLRQTVEKHLKTKTPSDMQPQIPNPAFSAAANFQVMQFAPNRMNPMGRPVHPANLPFVIPPPFALNCFNKLPIQPTTSTSSLFPFPPAHLPRPIPRQIDQLSEIQNTNPMPEEEAEIDVERVDEDKNATNTTKDSGLESPDSNKSPTSKVWRPFS